MRSLLLAPLALLLACGGRESTSAKPSNDAGSDVGSIDDTAPSEDTAPIDAGPPPYPDGPYGITKGSTVPPLVASGRHGSDPSFTTISLSDYYDPTGDRGITGLLVAVEGIWCGPCNVWADDLVRWWPTYRDQGARFLDFVWEDKSTKPGDPTAVDAWIAAHHIDFDVIYDPSATLAPKVGLGSWGIPHTMLIDPRTMRIVIIFDGIDQAQTTCKTSATCCTVASGGCSVDYKCSAIYTTCLDPSRRSPIPGLTLIMENNGATLPPAF